MNFNSRLVVLRSHIDLCCCTLLSLTIAACCCAILPTTAEAQITQVINVPSDPVPTSIGNGTQLNVFQDVTLADDFSAGPGSELNVENSVIGGLVHATGAAINIMGEDSRIRFRAVTAGSVLNLAEGRILGLASLSESTLHVTDGYVLQFHESRGSHITLDDGGMASVHLLDNSVLRMMGGQLLGYNRVEMDSQLFVSGDASIETLVFSRGSQMTMDGGEVFDSVSLSGSGTADNLTRAHLRMNDGFINAVVLIGGSAELHGGSTNLLNMLPGSIAEIYDGMTVGSIALDQSSMLTIHGGEVTTFDDFTRPSNVNIAGGTIGSDFIIGEGSQIDIAGGTIDGYFVARSNSEVHFAGHQFFLDGQPVEGLDGGPLVITDRDKTLSGTLADGTPFSYELNSVFSGSGRGNNPTADFFPTSTMVTISLVPEPATLGVFLTALAGVSFWKLARPPASADR